MHIFPYSVRKGTQAENYTNQVSEKDKKYRCAILQEISKKKYKDFLSSNIGKENEVIIEKKRDKETNLLKGVTKNYINVLIEGSDNLKDSLQKIIITDFSLDNEKMIARI